MGERREMFVLSGFLVFNRYMAQGQLQRHFFYALLLGVILLSVLMFQPYLVTLAVAGTFAVVLQPVYRGLQLRFSGKKTLSALLTVLLTILLVLLPLTFFGTQIVQEASELYLYLSSGNQEFSSEVINLIEAKIHAIAPQANVDLGRYVGQLLSWLTGHIGSLFASTIQTLIRLVLGIVAFYYLLRDGGDFLRAVIRLSPLTDKDDRRIMTRLEIAINSIVKGSLLVALAQGILAGIGLAFFGVPSASLWGSFAAIGSLLPGLGTAIILLPAVLYLFFSGHLYASIGLLVWSTLVVGLSDNILKPFLIGRDVNIHPLLILISVIGGIEFFGPLGFLLGPLVLSLLYALLDIYQLLLSQERKEELID